MKDLKLVVVPFAALAIVSAGGCAKPPAEEGSPSAQSNRNAARTNANVHDLTATPLYTNTVRGDVERAGLAVQMAHDFVKQQKWPDAVAQLRAAQSHIEKALEKELRLKDNLEATRAALLGAITTVEGRGSDIEAKFTDLQTRINALKVYTTQQ